MNTETQLICRCCHRLVGHIQGPLQPIRQFFIVCYGCIPHVDLAKLEEMHWDIPDSDCPLRNEYEETYH